MTPTTTDIRLDLELDLDRARIELIDARQQQRHKDTPSNRAAVTACHRQIDDLLDLHLELSRARLP